MKSWLVRLWEDGYIVPFPLLWNSQAKEIREKRIENLKLRYFTKEPVVADIDNVYPVQMNIQIDLSKLKSNVPDCGITRIIHYIVTMINPRDIYMYNVAGKGTGYKYYLGEKVIVYQLVSVSTTNEKKKFRTNLEKEEINGHNKTRERVRQILINTVPCKTPTGWKKYTMKADSTDELCKVMNLVWFDQYKK